MEWALLALSVALTISTIVYSIFTARMAAEMQASRLQSVRPRLALEIVMRTPRLGVLGLRSLGPGTAMAVDVEITYDPPKETLQWQGHVLAPGERAEFYFPTPPGSANTNPELQELSDTDLKVQVSGTVTDVLGNQHSFDESLSVKAWWTLVMAARTRYVEDPQIRLTKEVEKIRLLLEKRP